MVVSILATFPITKEALTHFKSHLGIDRGGSATKISFITRCSGSVGDEKTDEYILKCALVSNKNFSTGIEWLKKEVTFPVGVIGATGMGGAEFRGEFEKQFDARVDYINEGEALHTGFRYLLKNMTRSQYTFPLDEPEQLLGYKPDDFPGPLGDKELAMIKQLIGRDASADDEKRVYPTCIAMYGSAIMVFKVDAEGNFGPPVSHAMVAGVSFLGLCKALLGTSDYGEITTLAETGDRSRVDTTSLDIISNESRAYGAFKHDIPLFPLGKVVDKGLGRDDFTKPDLARALCGLFACHLATHLVSCLFVHGLRRIFIGGSFFQSKVMRDELLRHVWSFYGTQTLDLHFMNTGHTGAIGTMLR